MRTHLWVIALLALAFGTGASSEASTARGRREVQIRSVAFAPLELNVELGDTVVWRNVDIVRHSATRAELFDTNELKPGESFAWVPTDTGTYSYRCSIHEGMRGKIMVTTKKDAK